MSTTTKYFNVIEAILKSKNGRIFQSELEILLGKPPRSTWFKNKKELINEDYGLLEEVKCPEHEPYFRLKSFNDNFQYLEKKEAYMLEAYRHLGFLLDTSFDTIKINSSNDVSHKDLNELHRKFFYLSKNHAKQITKKQKEIYDNLTTSMLQNKEVFLNYPSDNDPKAQGLRRVRPLTICYHLDDMYLLGYEEKSINGDFNWVERNYKLNRIQNLKLSNEEFKYPSTKKWNPEQEYKNASGLYKGEVQTAQANIYGLLRKLLKEKNIMNSKLLSEHDDYDTYEFKYTDTNEFIGSMLIWAEVMEITTPNDLIDSYISKLESGLETQKNNRLTKLKKVA